MTINPYFTKKENKSTTMMEEQSMFLEVSTKLGETASISRSYFGRSVPLLVIWVWKTSWHKSYYSSTI